MATSAFPDLTADVVARYRHTGRARAAAAQDRWSAKVLKPVHTARDSTKRPKLTDTAARAATRRVVDSDSVSWLAAHPVELDQIKYLSDVIGEIAGDATENLATGGSRHRVADHFWCDILASIVWALENVETALEKLETGAIGWLVDTVWSQIRTSRATDCGNTPGRRAPQQLDRHERDCAADVTDELLKRWTTMLLQGLCDGLLTQKITFDAIVLKLRILALVLCPDAVAHKIVWDHCFLPLFRQWTGEEVHETLQNFLPQLVEPAAWTGPPSRFT
ncbi:hypothetical protein [Nocardia sp. NPDC058666]|uniref:hypothetical protein n=1 Tax=unclassified Nocardia TaxID=2637762 RepID=UPI0036653526